MDDVEELEDVTPKAPVFMLVPLNQQAKRATEHPRNQYYQVPINSETVGLWLSFEHPEKNLFSLGRANCDIYLPEVVKSSKTSSEISHYQASFHVVPGTGAVLLTDHSEYKNTEPYSNENTLTIPFRENKRSVLVCRGINIRVAFGRERWYQFAIKWTSDGLYDFPVKDEPYSTGPRKARVKKYLQGDKVGGGAYGNVFWVIDVVTGLRIAVKKFHNLSEKNLEFATREVRHLFKIGEGNAEKHKHILEILDAAGGRPGDEWGEIFMPLMAGNLKTLVEDSTEINDDAISDVVLRQMLHALDCMVSHRLIHRDIKPENILWDFDEDRNYHFRLGDFGLSNEVMVAKTVAGTEPFMAPEVFNRQPQSTKVDIWSLFATVVWVRNTENFRDRCGRMSVPNVHKLLVDISFLDEYENIRTMANRNPARRPSAYQLLQMMSGVNPDDDLSEEMAAMGFEVTSPSLEDTYTDAERPYYEPYGTSPPPAPSSFSWGSLGQSSQGKGKGKGKYVPRSDEGYPDEAFVNSVEATYQHSGEDEEDDDTVVPHQWTARPMATKDDNADSHRTKGKGKREDHDDDYGSAHQYAESHRKLKGRKK